MMTTLNQPMCVEMAVGPNVEQISDAPTIDRQAQSCHLPDGDSCIGLPYQDHNYGAPLHSKLPLPSISPYVTLSTTCTQSDMKMCMKPMLPISNVHHIPPHHKNGVIKQNCLSAKLLHVKKESHGSDSILGDVTRCICGFTHDDGYMIACDRCRVWQHIDCVNIDRNNIPDTYLCDRCNPRKLNREEAMHLQEKKLNDLSIGSEIESSGAESADDRDHARVTYTAIQSTPTSLTITSNRTAKRTESTGIGKKRKRSRDDVNKRPGKKTNNSDRKRSRSISKVSFSDAHSDERLGTFVWARKLKEWNESYRNIDENHYTPELLQAVLSSTSSVNANKQAGGVVEQLRKQLVKVQQLRNKVLAMEDVCTATPVLEVVGSYMLSNQTEASKLGIFKRPYPHMFFYNGFDGVEVVVDCRVVGNIARYLRRSCRPNSEVRHVIEENRLYLIVYSRDSIANGSEITIPFDFKYQNCLYDVECGCGKFNKDCPVYKYTNMRMARNPALTNSMSKQVKNKDVDGGRVSPLRLSISRINEHMNGYPGSDQDHSNNADLDQEGSNQESQRKKSREDRKMEHYIRYFERLEKQEKRKEQSSHVTGDGRSFVKDHNAVVSSAAVSQPSTPCSVVSDDKYLSASTISQPARRINRRRSTKSGRRSSKKFRVPSYDGVLSPTLSTENNDSNHSSDTVASTVDAMPAGGMADSGSSQLQPLESNTESMAVCEQDVLPYLGDSMSALQSPCASAGAEAFPIVTLTTTAQSLPAVVATTTDDVNTVSSPHAVVSNDKAESDCDKQSATDTAQVIADVRVQEPVNTVSSNKPAKKKCSSNSGDASAGASKQDQSLTASSFFPPICCTSFKNWDYRPGIPNGRVHVGIGRLPGRRYLGAELHLKKNWLRHADKEGLVSKASDGKETGLSSNNVRSHFIHKKHLLKSYLAKNGDANESSSRAEDLPSIATQQDLTQELTANSMGFTEETVTSLPSQVAPPAQYPVIEYESLSDDNEDVHSNASSSLSVEEPGGDDVDETSKLGFEEGSQLSGIHPLNAHLGSDSLLSSSNTDVVLKPANQAGAAEENPASSSKKKVSFQEYLKRSKEQRKSSSTHQTTANQNPSTVITTTSTPTLHLQTVTTAPIVVTTTSISVSTTPLQSCVLQTSSSESSVTTTPTSVHTPSKEVETKQDSPKKEVEEELCKLVANVVKPANEGLPVDVQELIVEALNTSPAALKKLPSEVLHLFNEWIKTLSPTNEESPKDNQANESKSSEEVIQKVPKEPAMATSSDRKEVKSNSTLIRPHVERSHSSPNIRHPSTRRDSSAKKVSGSQHSSPSSRHSTPGGAAPSRKDFASPVPSASPRLVRGHSGSSINSHSPTPTIYDRRHRPEFSNKDTAVSSTKSRHNSGTPIDVISSKSSPADFNRHQSKHNSSTQEHNKPSSATKLRDLPQKVPSITPDVPGQPIPSLARGPGATQFPQAAYSGRLSPTHPDGGSPSWDTRDPPPARSLKDVPYNRHESYHPPRMPSPNPHSVDRSYHDKYYDRYPAHPNARSSRHEDELLPPPPLYHHPPYHLVDYRNDRPNYYPPREARPPSPVPPSRPNFDYYHRSNYYLPPPPQDYRR